MLVRIVDLTNFHFRVKFITSVARYKSFVMKFDMSRMKIAGFDNFNWKFVFWCITNYVVLVHGILSSYKITKDWYVIPSTPSGVSSSHSVTIKGRGYSKQKKNRTREKCRPNMDCSNTNLLVLVLVHGQWKLSR